MKNVSILLVIIFLVSSCSNPDAPNYDTDYNTISSMDIKEAIVLANDWKFSKPDIMSFITSKELKIIFPDSRELVIALPENEMYVAIAPYINETHSCSTHYLSGCQGEMVNKEFDIIVKNLNNEIIEERTVSTMRNGFFEIWLPKNEKFDVKLKYQDKSSDFHLETFDGSNTCVTTVRLK